MVSDCHLSGALYLCGPCHLYGPVYLHGAFSLLCGSLYTYIGPFTAVSGHFTPMRPPVRVSGWSVPALQFNSLVFDYICCLIEWFTISRRKHTECPVPTDDGAQPPLRSSHSSMATASRTRKGKENHISVKEMRANINEIVVMVM